MNSISTSHIIRTWNGKSIRQRADGYINLTDMAQACGKQFGHWKELKATESYLKTLSSVIGITKTELIQINQGGVPSLQGTWGHRKVAIRFAQWCSDEFAVQVDSWIEELLDKGSVSIVPSHQSEPVPKPLQLPPADIRISNFITALDRVGFELDNPRFNQAIKDVMGDILGVKALPPSNAEPRWLGVVERALELGYPTKLVTFHRSMLGRRVKKTGLEYRLEKRLCNGTMKDIALYQDSAELDSAISAYLNQALDSKN